MRIAMPSPFFSFSHTAARGEYGDGATTGSRTLNMRNSWNHREARALQGGAM